MAEPAEDDVERLAEWAHLPGVTSVSEDRQVALNLLRRGVTLPPEPDTPPEPQERFYVEASADAIPHPRWWVLDRAGERDAIRTDTPEDAERVALCLNLDAKYEDGIEAEIERLRLRADAFQAKFEEQCQQGDDMFIGHYKAIKRAVTAEAELEGLQDRFPPTTNQPVTAEMVRRVLGESGALAVAADQGLSPFDVADRLNGLLGRTPHRPEDR